jgi:sugar-specific transcriptional regulator TrmB
MTEQDEIYSSLIHFGLDEAAVTIYVSLLKMGPMSVGTMSQKLDLDRGKAYRSLKVLEEMGMTKSTSSTPIKISAIDPTEAFENIIQNKKEHATKLRTLAASLIEELKNYQKESTPTEMSSFSIIQGRSNIYTKIGKLIQNSTENIFLVTTSDDLMRMHHTSIPDKIHQRIEAGGEVRIITNPCEEKFMKVFEDFGATQIKIGKLPSKSRMVIESKSQMAMSGAMNESIDLNDDSDSIMYTDSSEMVENMFTLCSHLWKKSKPMQVSN